jgi:SAM-dependent methyltransferase
MDNSYLKIVDYYNKAFDQYGDTPKGLAWDNQSNLNKRYKVMFDLIKYPTQITPNTTVLDFGCGYGGFYKWIKEHEKLVEYIGLDINKEVLKIAKEKYPKITWLDSDIHENIFDSNFDYIICNGTFTVKDTLTQEEMTNFMCSTLEKLWAKTNKGIAFNVMSKLVDWERDDLFHVSMDQLGQWLIDNLSRNFVIKNDYGLYEYTVYVYKN